MTANRAATARATTRTSDGERAPARIARTNVAKEHDYGRDIIDLDDPTALGLAVGERVIVETREGENAVGEVTAPGIVSAHTGLGSPGRAVFVRRPRCP